MKRFTAVLLCGLLLLTLTSCQSENADASQTTSTPMVSGSGASTPTSATINIQLKRVEKELKADDGQVLVRYAYDAPTITISNHPLAQQVIQSDLSRLVQDDLIPYAKKDLLPLAQEAYQQQDTANLPYCVELNLTIQRTDESVISILSDQISATAGAHSSDYRSARNYCTETGKRLTFAMLGDGFRAAATELVTNQAQQHAASLFEGYQENISHVVLDGTEDAKEIHDYYSTSVDPTFYLTNQDIVFISREYELQRYAAGIIEFPIPYAAFGHELNDAFLPHNYNNLSNSPIETVPKETDAGEQAFQPQDQVVPAGTLEGNGWVLTIPKEWADKVYVTLDDTAASFYENGCYSEMGGGWLFSLESYNDDSYVELPDYELLSINGDISYVAVYPTDVQFEGASAKNAQRYSAFSNQVEDVLHTFALSN